jgi:predicted deacylase
MSTITIGGISAAPGEKVKGFLDAGTTSVNTLRVPLAIINGAEKGKTLGIIGGTHGTEFASIEAVIRAIKALDPRDMWGAVLAVPVLNGPQFEHKTMFLSPFDQLNLNRVFPGDKEGTLSQRIAYTVYENVIKRCDALMDCHGGDVNEDIHNYVIAGKGDDEEINKTALDMARCFPTRFINQFPVTPTGMTMCAQSRLGIPCITSESGTPFPVREDEVEFHYVGIMNVLRYFGVIEGKPDMVEPVIGTGNIRLKAKEGGIWRPSVTPDLSVKIGDVLGVVTDLFGEEKQKVTAPCDGMVGMMRCYYSVNCGELLVSITTLD